MTWKVSDVMTRDVVTVGPATSFKTCVDLLRIHGISALPVVVANCRLVGIVSEQDLMRKLASIPDFEGDPTTGGTKAVAVSAGELMTTHVAVISPDAALAVAARLMVQRQVKRLPVVDPSNRLLGILSRADVLKVFLRSDESIRKEIDHMLNYMPLIGRGNLHAEVLDGVVRLYGEMESGGLTDLLVRLVRAVPGVVGVEDHLRLVDTLGTPNLRRAPRALELDQRASAGSGLGLNRKRSSKQRAGSKAERNSPLGTSSPALADRQL